MELPEKALGDEGRRSPALPDRAFQVFLQHPLHLSATGTDELHAFEPCHLAVTYDGLTKGSLTRKAFGVLAFEDFKTRLDAMVSDPALDDPRVTHIKFKPFIKDTVGTLRVCYQQCGFDRNAETEAAMRAWLVDPNHDSDRYGRGDYTFAPFGVDWEKQAPLFDGYRARFLGAAGVTSA